MKKELKIVFIGRENDYENFLSNIKDINIASITFSKIYFTDYNSLEKTEEIIKHIDSKTLLLSSSLSENKDFIFKCLKKKCHLFLFNYKDLTIDDYDKLYLFSKERGIAFLIDLFGYSKALILKKMMNMYVSGSNYIITANDSKNTAIESEFLPLILAITEKTKHITITKEKENITIKTKMYTIIFMHKKDNGRYISCEAENNWYAKWDINEKLSSKHKNGIKENYLYEDDASYALEKIYENIILHCVGLCPALYTAIEDLHVYLKIKEKLESMKDGENADISL